MTQISDANFPLEKVFIKVIKAGLFILPFIPLIFVPSFFFPFITWKNFLFRIIVELIGSLWLALAILKKEYRPRGLLLTYAFSGLIVIAIFSTIFSVDSFRSFWSNFERMEGLITYLHLFVFFLVLASVMKTERDWTRLLFVSISASVLVSFYGLLEKAGAISSLTEGGRIFSTIGNSIYLAIYLLFHLFFIAWAYLRTRATWLKVILASAFFVDFLAFIFAESRGALVGLIFGVALATLFAFFRSKSPKIKYALGVMIIIGASLPFLFIKFQDRIAASNIPGVSRLAAISFSEATAVSRFQIWEIAYTAIKERPILGWGFENFQIPYAEHYIPSLFGNEPWFDRAHNVVIDWFVSAGVLGGLSYLFLFASVFWTIWRLFKTGSLSEKEAILVSGMTSAYLIQNLFVFDNITSHLLFFSFLGFLAYKAAPKETSVFPANSESDSKIVIVPAAALVLGLVLVILVNGRPILQSRSLIKTMNVTAAGQDFRAVLEGFEKTLDYGTFGKREVREQLANLANTVTTTRTTLTGEDILALMNLTISELENETKEHFSPKHEIFLARMRKQYFSLTGQRYDEAASQFERAIELAPGYIHTRFGLIELYLAANETEKAVAELEYLRSLKPRSVAFWNTIATAYVFIENEKGASDSLLEAGTIGVKLPPDNLERLAQNARARNLNDLAIVLFKLAEQGSGSAFSSLSLAELYAERGDYDLAIRTAEDAARKDPSLESEVQKFVESVKAVRGF